MTSGIRNWAYPASIVLAVGAFGYAGYVLGFAASYYLGDYGDVGSAFIAVVTCPIGIVLGLFLAVVLVKKLFNGPFRAVD